MNAHSYGGYFMWPPGAYIANGRISLPYQSLGDNQFFDETATDAPGPDQGGARHGHPAGARRPGLGRSVLRRRQQRGRSLVQRPEPVRRHERHFGYDFEIGADRFNSTTTGTSQTAVGFQPNFATESHDQGMEFAAGTYGLIEATMKYQLDHTPPVVSTTITMNSPGGGLDVTLTRASLRTSTTPPDGSTPTTSSPRWDPPGLRQRLLPVHLPGPVTLKYMAVDVKGQRSAVRPRSGLPGQRRRQRLGAGDAGTDTWHAGELRAVRPGRREGLHGIDDRDRDLIGRRRGAERLGPGRHGAGYLLNGAFSLPQALQVQASVRSARAARPPRSAEVRPRC